VGMKRGTKGVTWVKKEDGVWIERRKGRKKGVVNTTVGGRGKDVCQFPRHPLFPTLIRINRSQLGESTFISCSPIVFYCNNNENKIRGLHGKGPSDQQKDRRLFQGHKNTPN